MNYDIQFTECDGYIHARITGDNSRDAVAAALQDILEECQRRNYARVLIEECLEGPRLDTMDVFSVVSEGAMAALGQFDAVAYVDENATEMMEFAEDVAVNRGMPASIFTTVEAAEKWLKSQIDGSGSSVFPGVSDPSDD